jgi:hypothetical protein
MLSEVLMAVVLIKLLSNLGSCWSRASHPETCCQRQRFFEVDPLRKSVLRFEGAGDQW